MDYNETMNRFNAISSAFESYGVQLVIRVRHHEKVPELRCYATLEHIEVKGDSVLISAYGDGATPEEAIINYYNQIVGKTLVCNAYGKNRKEIVVV